MKTPSQMLSWQPLRSAVAPAGEAPTLGASSAHRVLRNTYALLATTLVFSAGIAAVSVMYKLPSPGFVLTLVGYFGLLFAVVRLRTSAWALAAVFALTGFMGYTLGPLLSRSLAMSGGGLTVAVALGITGLTFAALSAFALTTRRDFSFMGTFLLAGMIVALIAGAVAVFMNVPALALVVAAAVALISAGLILYETSRIVNGGETNYVLATVSLYVSIYNLFASLLSLFGLGNSDA